jgi:hypothetical protein
MTLFKRVQIAAAVSMLGVALGAAGVEGQGTRPPASRIAVTEVPPQDCGGPIKQATIAGTVTGSVAPDERILIYAAACNGVLYVQPTVAASLTTVLDGKFNSYIHLGHTYYVILVKSSFKPKPEMGEADVPRVGGDVIAIAKVPGKK